jgi:hypothetical protein
MRFEMQKPMIVEDKEGKENVEFVNFAFDGVYLGTTMCHDSEYKVPTGIYDALTRKESIKWIPSAAYEVMTFIEQKCWKKVPCTKPESLGNARTQICYSK